MKIFSNMSDLVACVGQEVAVSEWITIEQTAVDQFAQATGDHQWIHVDPVKAASGPYGTTIAHGFMTLSLLPRFFESSFAIENSSLGVNYGLNKVRFTAPVPAGARVRGHFVLQAYEPIEQGAQLTVGVRVELEGAAKPACIAETVSRRFV